MFVYKVTILPGLRIFFGSRLRRAKRVAREDVLTALKIAAALAAMTSHAISHLLLMVLITSTVTAPYCDERCVSSTDCNFVLNGPLSAPHLLLQIPHLPRPDPVLPRARPPRLQSPLDKSFIHPLNPFHVVHIIVFPQRQYTVKVPVARVPEYGAHHSAATSGMTSEARRRRRRRGECL